MSEEMEKADAMPELTEEKQGILDELVGMTATSEEETSSVKAAFTHLLGSLNALPEGARLKTAIIEDAIAKLDEQLSQQVAAIMKHETFKEVEASWRGLAFLAGRTDFAANIRISVVQATKAELLEDLREADTLDQSHIFKTVYTNEYDMPGGRPFGSIIGNFKFDSGSLDVELLSQLSDVAEAAHAPFISSIKPEFFKVRDWEEFQEIPNLAPYLDGKDFAEWKTFREKSSAIYAGLAFPGFLLRQPYGPNGEQAKTFSFSEQAEQHNDYLWGNGAFAHASKIHESFANSGWVVNISGGKSASGMVGDLPAVEYNLGAEITKISGEVLISGAQEKEISDAGFLGMSAYKNEATTCFFGCQSTAKPKVYDSPDATANAKMETMLAYLFPVSRVAHYLKSIQRDNIGSFATPSEMEGDLDRWLKQYYSKDNLSTPELCGKRPFVDYEVKVTENPSNPGWYNMDVWVQPRVILQGVEGKLHLVAKVPGK